MGDYTQKGWQTSFLDNLLLLLIAFKLCGIITWSWWVVLWPLWVVVGFIVMYLLVVLYVKILEHK